MLRQPEIRMPVPLAGADGEARWVAWKADGTRWRSRDKVGKAEGTTEAIGRARMLVMECTGCDGLLVVDLNAARRASRRVDRSVFMPGDGCYGCNSSRHHRWSRHVQWQRRKAAAVLAGEKVVIEQPG